MKKPPAFQLYAGDFLSGTQDMTCEEVGAYIRLLCVEWDRGELPNDPTRLQVLAGCTADACAFVMKKFRINEAGNLQNARLEEVRTQQQKYRESRSLNASKRWRKNDETAHSKHMHYESNAYEIHPPSSPTQTPKGEKGGRMAPSHQQAQEYAAEKGIPLDRFEKWWSGRIDADWRDSKGSTMIHNWQRWLTNYGKKCEENDQAPVRSRQPTSTAISKQLPGPSDAAQKWREENQA